MTELYLQHCHTLLSGDRLLAQADGGWRAHLYRSSLLRHVLISSEGSRASRLTQERAEMLVTGLPSCTTSRLAFVSFPAVVEAGGRGKHEV